MDNCCLNIYGVGLIEKDIVFECNSVVQGEYPDFSFDSGDGTLNISYDSGDSLWYLSAGAEILATSSYDTETSCPDGLQFAFSGGDMSPNYTFTVYQVPCDLNPVPPTIEYPLECVEEPCRNKNLLNKHRALLAEDIAGISKKEVFGFKCGDAWENIFMRNMIIHALSCMPTGVLSVEKENCLIGKLTDKCNC